MKIKLDKNPWVMTAYLLSLFTAFYCYTFAIHFIYIILLNAFSFSLRRSSSIAIVRRFIWRAFYESIIKSYGMAMEAFLSVLVPVGDIIQDSIAIITFLCFLFSVKESLIT